MANGDVMWDGVAIDITEQKIAEEGLRESEATLRAVIDGIHDVVFVKDRQGRYTIVNHAAPALFGKTANELVGKTDTQTFPTDIAQMFAGSDHRIFMTGVAETVEHAIEVGDAHLHFLTTKGVYRGRNDDILGIVGISRDMTARKVMEDAVRGSEATLRAVIEGISDAVFVKDIDGRYVISNAANADMSALPLDEIIGKTDAELYEPKHAKMHVETDRQVLESGEAQSYEREFDAFGERRFHLTTKSVYRDSDGWALGIVGVTRDLTDRKRMEDDLRQAQRMEAVGQLTGGIAHDFNNLLGVIMGSLELLNEGIGDEEARSGHLQRAIKAGERGAALTERLLAFSRKQALQPRATNVNLLLTDMLELLRQILEENVEIKTVMSPKLWYTEVDQNQLENALLNLVVNARDAMPEGGKLSIETENRRFRRTTLDSGNRAIPAGDYIVLSLSDTGVGMPPDVVARAFDPFFTTKEVGKGSGLGLSMVYGFVEQSGGHVAIESEPARGTTVRIFLPRGKVRPRTAKARVTLGARSAAHGETILIVEDDDDVRHLVISMLTSLGYQTLEAQNGPSALAILETDQDVALMFTDIVLAGGMSGVELVRAARGHRPDIKVLYTSGYAEDALSQKGRLEDGVELVQKPYRRAELARKVREILRGDGVAGKMKPVRSGKQVSETRELADARTSSREAFRHYLRGQQMLFQYTKEGNAAARQLFERAIELDSAYGRAFAALSKTFNHDWRYSWSENPAKSLDLAVELAERAVALDDKDARGHSELVYARLYKKQNDSAVAEYEKALELDPNDADIMAEMADALVHYCSPSALMGQIEVIG